MNEEKYILQSVANTLDILDLLGQYEELSVPEISSITGMSKSSVFRMLATLENRNFIKKSEDAKYRLGLKLNTLGRFAMDHMDIIRYGHPYLVELTSQTGETSHMAVLDQDIFVRFVDKVLSLTTIRTDSTIGFRRRAHLVACGKVLLAYQSPKEIETYIKNVSFEPMTEFSIPNGDKLLEELSLIRRQGFAFDRQESEYGLFCIAAPVFDNMGIIAAAISVSGPMERMTRNIDNILPQLIRTASHISHTIQ